MRNLLSIIFILILIVAAHAQQSEVEQAKGTEVAGFPYTNTGKAFDEFFMKPQWTVFTDNAGTKTVVFKGIFQSNPYAAYAKSNEFKNLSEEQRTALVKSLYNVAYDYGLRSDRLYGADDTKARQALSFLADRAYKLDSSIEAYFQLLGDGKSWWVKEYKCDTCPTRDVNDLYALVFGGRFVGALDTAKRYAPANTAIVTVPIAAPAPVVAAPAPLPTPAPAPVNIPDKKLATTTKIAQFYSLEGESAYFDIGKGEQEFSVSPRALPKVQALKKSGMTHIIYDTVERYVDGNKTTVYIVTDVK